MLLRTAREADGLRRLVRVALHVGGSSIGMVLFSGVSWVGGGQPIPCMAVVCETIDLSRLCNAETEHVGLSPTIAGRGSLRYHCHGN